MRYLIINLGLSNEGDEQKTVEIEEWRSHNNGVIAKLVGIDTRTDAETIKNLDILIEETSLPTLAEDEYYWRDLVGMKVFTNKGYDMGVVKGVI